MITIVILSLTLNAQAGDTVQLLATARQAQAAYEASVFSAAEFSASAARLVEPLKVTISRDSAIIALHHAFQAMRGNKNVVFPLIRDLVEANRFEQAIASALTYAKSSVDSDGLMVVGYALNAGGYIEAALRYFEAWISVIPPADRSIVTDVKPLTKRGTKFPNAEVAWRFADALYLTPENETLSEHFARFAAIRMLKEVPRRDTDVTREWFDRTVRFGLPVLTTRTFSTNKLVISRNSHGTILRPSPVPTLQFEEHWISTQRTYFPPSSENINMRARVDTLWPLTAESPVSAHAPSVIRIMLPIQHQFVVFPLDSTVFIRGAIKLDDTVNRAALVGFVFLLDSAFTIVTSVRAKLQTEADSVVMETTARLPGRAQYYSAEIYDSVSHFAARARYRIPPFAIAKSLKLSGITLGNVPTGPLSRPVVESGRPFRINAKLTNLLDRARSLQVRIRLGTMTSEIGWSQDVPAHVTSDLEFTVDPGMLKPGVCRLTLVVQDVATGEIVRTDADMLFK